MAMKKEILADIQKLEMQVQEQEATYLRQMEIYAADGNYRAKERAEQAYGVAQKLRAKINELRMPYKEIYKGYLIEITKAKDSWVAKITREDGNLFKVLNGDTWEQVSDRTFQARPSEDEALAEAKRAIDGGGMSPPA